MSYKYGINKKYEFTKDGHTMFNADVLRDLERKSFLEVELQEYKELNESFDFRHKADTETMFALEEEIEANKKLLRKYSESSDRGRNKIKADAIEEARLSLVIYTKDWGSIFAEGADWGFDELSKQLEDRVAELTEKIVT